MSFVYFSSLNLFSSCHFELTRTSSTMLNTSIGSGRPHLHKVLDIPYSILISTPLSNLKHFVSGITSIHNLFLMFPSFLRSQKPDCPLMIMFSLQELKSWLCFLPLPLYHRAWRPSWCPPCSSLLLSVHSPFSSLNAPDLNLQSSDYITQYPFLLLLSFSSMVTSLHFVMNVSSGLFLFLTLLHS